MAMSIDLWMLVWAVILTFVQIMVPATGMILQGGLAAAAGNREGLAPAEGAIGRATRAYRNMLENLPLFAALVLVAHVAQQANEMTALGAQLFLWARLAHAVIYVAGIPYLRTLAWLVAVIGMAIIFAQLF